MPNAPQHNEATGPDGVVKPSPHVHALLRGAGQGRRGCDYCGRSVHGNARSCKRRSCSGYVNLWMGDQSARLLENLWAYRGQVAMVTITPPGADRLPWDRDACTHGPDVKCSGTIGCKVSAWHARDFNESAMRRWSALWASVRVDCHRKFGPGVVQLLAYGIEPQQRGVIHLHICLGAGSKRERNCLRYAARLLARRAGNHGWGKVDDRPAFKQLRNAGSAAAYLSKYLTKQDHAKGVRALLMDGHAPARCFYVSPRLSTVTRATMRNLRGRRYVWARTRRTVACSEVQRELRELRLSDLWDERHSTLRGGASWARIVAPD